MNTPCVLYFYVVFFKNKRFQAHFCKKKTLLSVIELLKICLFPVELFHVKNVFHAFNLWSERNDFYVKQIVFNRKIWKQLQTNQQRNQTK